MAREKYLADNGEAQCWMNRKHRYGMTKADFTNMYEKQFKLCAVCREKLPGKRATHIDHNHKTGKIRGLLCPRCNMVLGYLEERPGIIHNFIDYLMEDKNHE